jgi:DNA-binding FadR family transcriptional regulator
MYDYIEIQSAALAAIRRTTDDVARLAAIVAEMRRNLHIPDAYVELDVAFHRLIASMTRNAMIYHSSLTARLLEHNRAVFKTQTATIQTCLQDVLHLLRALDQRIQLSDFLLCQWLPTRSWRCVRRKSME